MSLSALPTPEHDLVDVTADSLVLTNLVVHHPETVAIASRQLTEHGPDALADLIRRAVPVGLLALTTGAAATDTAVIQRTLDDFARNVDDRSAAALAGLNQTLDRLRAGEQAVAKAAQDALSRLPAQLESVLSGEAGNVRAAVKEAARAVQDAGTAEVRAALTQHSESVRNALSLDREGPVQSLRSDILTELNGTRRELAEQMAGPEVTAVVQRVWNADDCPAAHVGRPRSSASSDCTGDRIATVPTVRHAPAMAAFAKVIAGLHSDPATVASSASATTMMTTLTPEIRPTTPSRYGIR